MRIAGLAFVCALLSACAGPRPAAEPPAFLFKDDAFAAPEESFAASDLFALNEQMRRFLAHDIAVQLHSSGPTNGLIEALYSKNQLKLSYDAARTRNAAEAFNARAGNCLSMVIMTAAFAKELGLPVEYNAAGYEEVWSRSGNFLLGSGHVNVSVGARDSDIGLRVVGRPLTVDFLPPEDIRGLPSREIPEQVIVAMYMNNKSVESLMRDELDEAYGWAREAIRRSPEFASSYNTLGIVYLHRGDPAQAARVFAYALEQAPDNTSVMANLADVLSRLGDEAGAAALRSRLARIDPNPIFQPPPRCSPRKCRAQTTTRNSTTGWVWLTSSSVKSSGRDASFRWQWKRARLAAITTCTRPNSPGFRRLRADRAGCGP